MPGILYVENSVSNESCHITVSSFARMILIYLALSHTRESARNRWCSCNKTLLIYYLAKEHLHRTIDGWRTPHHRTSQPAMRVHSACRKSTDKRRLLEAWQIRKCREKIGWRKPLTNQERILGSQFVAEGLFIHYIPEKFLAIPVKRDLKR